MDIRRTGDNLIVNCEFALNTQKLERNHALRITHIREHNNGIIKYAICLQNPKTQ